MAEMRTSRTRGVGLAVPRIGIDRGVTSEHLETPAGPALPYGRRTSRVRRVGLALPRVGIVRGATSDPSFPVLVP
jgi:hypothetical protein